MPAQLPIRYTTASSVEDALDLLEREAETQVVASGYSLIPLVKDGVEQPDELVDISGLDELRGISTKSGNVHIGALTTHGQIAASTTVQSRSTALAAATSSVGDYIAKQQGTIGGNVVFASPRYDIPSAVLALDATIVVRGPGGQRKVDVDEWFRPEGRVQLGSNELVTEIIIPHTGSSGYARTSTFESADSGYATVSIAAAIETDDDDIVNSARVAANGAIPSPTRLTNVEELLDGKRLVDNLAERAGGASLQNIDTEELIETDTAAGKRRLELVRKYCKQAIKRAASG